MSFVSTIIKRHIPTKRAQRPSGSSNTPLSAAIARDLADSLIDIRETSAMGLTRDWAIKRHRLLLALLPVSLLIEQCGIAVSAQDLIKLNRLEQLLQRASSLLGFTVEVVATSLRGILKELPEYCAASPGSQTASPCEHYSYALLGSRCLHELLDAEAC